MTLTRVKQITISLWFEGQNPSIDKPKEIGGVMQDTLEETVNFASEMIRSHWLGECGCTVESNEWEECSPRGSSSYWQYRDNQGLRAGRVVRQENDNGDYDYFAYGRLTANHKDGSHGKKIYPILGKFHSLEEAQKAVKSEV